MKSAFYHFSDYFFVLSLSDDLVRRRTSQTELYTSNTYFRVITIVNGIRNEDDNCGYGKQQEKKKKSKKERNHANCVLHFAKIFSLSVLRGNK